MTTLNIIKCTPQEAKEIIRRVIHMDAAKRPSVMVHGEPGCGKSKIIQQLAMEEFGNKPIVCHAAMMEASDVKGLPDLDRERRRVVWLKPDFLPREGRGILFLDEITSGRRDVMAALYPVTLDRKIDDLEIADGYAIVCAGNDTADGAIANPMGTALADRLLHLLVEATPESFVSHWETKGMNPAILALITQMPQLFTNNEQRIEQDLICSPTSRSWERAWHLLEEFNVEKSVEEATKDTARGARRRTVRTDVRATARRQLEIVLSGCLGIEAGGQLMLTIDDVKECVNPREILGAELFNAKKMLPKTLRSGIALAFALATIAKTPKEIIKSCAIMAMVAEARERGDIPAADKGDTMSGREIAAFGVEKLLAKAEETEIIDAVLEDSEAPGADLLRAYLEDVGERFDVIGAKAA